jgi:putative signal transducing protein
VKELLRSHSLSYVHGLRIALEAQGIETAVFDQSTVSFEGLAGRVRLMVPQDADFERARAIVREIEARAPAQQPVAGWRLQRLGCVAAVLGVTGLGFGGAAVADLSASSPMPPVVAYGLVGVAIVMTVAGLALILFGPRWGRSDPR